MIAPPLWLRNRMIQAGLAGVALAFGQAPTAFWPLALAGLAAALPVIAAAPGRRASARAGWAFGFGYFGLTLHWIVEPFFVDAARHGWMAPFALVGLAGGLALFWAAAGWFAAGARTRTGRLMALAAGLSLAELGRAYLLTGFPWALIGSFWLGTPVIQIVAWIGPHGLGALSLFALAAGAAVWPSSRLRAGLSAGLPLAILCGLGLVRVWTVGGLTDAPSAHVRMVQPNAAQHLKWLPEMRPVFFNRMLEMTAAQGAHAPDLVIWPETSITRFLHQADQDLARIAQAAQGRPVLAGIHTYEQNRVYNALSLIDSAGRPTALYRKSHLVPFGEYVPFASLMARIGVFGLAAFEGMGYAAGPGPMVLETGDAGRVLPLICYEAIFPRFGRDDSRHADWMIQVTNDAWFGHFAGPQQHLDQARLRAIERGLPLIRVANTGITAAIDPFGRVMARIPLNTAGAQDVTVPPRLPVTPYARLGDALVLLVLGLVTAASVHRRLSSR